MNIVALLLASLFFFGRQPAHAQENYESTKAVQVSPARFDWDLNSGQERTGVVNLKNYSGELYDVEIFVEDFYVSDDSSEAKFFVPDQNHPLYAYDVINWIEIQPAVELQPGEGRDISFKVSVPESTPTGGYYGALFFRSKVHNGGSDDAAGSRISINQRVGALLVMAVKGKEPIRREGKLDSFGPVKNIFWHSPAEIISRISNSGNLHFKGEGQIKVSRFGQVMDELKIEPRVMYPGRTREDRSQFNFSPWGYGYYKAELEWVSEDRGIRLSGTTTFWVIPWKTTLGLFGLLIILYVIYRIFTSKFEIRKK